MNIIFVGLSGVPYKKRACDTRLLSFANAFVKKRNDVTILNRLPICYKEENKIDKGLSAKIKIVELFKQNKINGTISLVYFTIFSYLKESIWLFNENKKNQISVLHLYSGHYFDFWYYHLISRIIGAKVVYQYVELRSSHNRKGLYHKINGILCDKLGYKLFDGTITISTYIENMLHKCSPSLPTIKIPPICNVSYYDHVEKLITKKKYILFCGSSEYVEVIKLIIDAYRLSIISKTHGLLLVLSGSEESKRKIENYSIKGITIKSGLNYKDLVKLYQGASALLIPLRNSVQDKARFPNKICEYSACRGVIITTNIGEIPYFFKDGKNALIADDFTAKSISNKLNILANMNDIDVLRIKDASYHTCISFFDISVYSDLLDDFLKNIISNKK